MSISEGQVDPMELGLYDFPGNVIDDFVVAERSLEAVLPQAINAAGNLIELLKAIPVETETTPTGTYENVVEAYDRLTTLMSSVVPRLGSVAQFTDEIPVALFHASGDDVDAFRHRHQ